MAVQQKAQSIINHVNDTFSPSNPATIRRIYYSLVTAGILPSCVESYNCVKVTMAAARRSGAVSYESIIDNCREAQTHHGWKTVADRAETRRPQYLRGALLGSDQRRVERVRNVPLV